MAASKIKTGSSKFPRRENEQHLWVTLNYLMGIGFPPSLLVCPRVNLPTRIAKIRKKGLFGGLCTVHLVFVLSVLVPIERKTFQQRPKYWYVQPVNTDMQCSSLGYPISDHPRLLPYSHNQLSACRCNFSAYIRIFSICSITFSCASKRILMFAQLTSFSPPIASLLL